jgi:hypothetical protein
MFCDIISIIITKILCFSPFYYNNLEVPFSYSGGLVAFARKKTTESLP